MIKYLLAFVLITPLIGVIMMEFGAYSFAAHEFGYPNNASLAYILYIIIFYFSYALTKKINFSFPKIETLKASYNTISILTLLTSFLFIIIILFFFGGYKVLLGQVDKGTFRISLGFFGAIAQLMTKAFLPSLLVLNAFYYKKVIKKRPTDRLILILNMLLAFIFGASWGFKSTAVFILIPPLIILYQRPSFFKVIMLAVLSLLIFVCFAMFFDNAKEISTEDIDLFSEINQSNPIEFILYRLTVLQGDPCWKIWDLHINGQLKDISYAKTLYASMGDGNLDRFLNINQSNYLLFIKYHFALLLTYLCGNDPSAIAEGYNVTGTVFCEGIIAGGIPGLIFFSIFSGILSALVVQLIYKGLKNNLPILTSISVAYFCFNIFSWLNGGGVATIFHISIIFGLALNFIILIIFVNLAKLIKL